MDSPTRVQKEVYDRVAAWTVELFTAAAKPIEGRDGYRVAFGSAFVELTVGPVGDSEAVVVARAPVVSGASLTPDLLRYLLRKNCDTRFGAFGVGDDGDIELRYSIVGTTCQKAELRAAVQYLMLAADLCDDEIVARWGGLRARDRA
jgi:hypothetical protein